MSARFEYRDGELPPGHVSTGKEEATSFMLGVLVGTGLSVVIVLAVVLIVLVAL